MNRLFNIVIFVCVLLLPVRSMAQDQKISVNFNNITLEEAIAQLEAKSGYYFLYNSTLISPKMPVNVTQTNATLGKILDEMFRGSDISYQFVDKQVVFYRNKAVAGEPEAKVPEGALPAATQNSPGSAKQSPAAVQGVITVRGKVLDEMSLPLSGAVVVVKGTKKIVSVDDDGVFELTDIDKNATLVITFPGYVTMEYKVDGRSSVDVQMEPNVVSLSEVVVTGYQTIAKERATGAFAILDSKTMDQKINIDASSAIEGKLSGVAVKNDGSILVRGRSTLSSNVGTNPLLVIDGMPTERTFNSINMNDVESFTVLKDAAASAIYGVRAANGVIVITTKKGETGKLKVDFSGDWQLTENPSLSDFHYASTPDIINYEMKVWDKDIRDSGTPNDELAYFNNLVKGIGTGNAPSYNISPLAHLRWQLARGGATGITQTQFNEALATMKQLDYRQEYMDNVWRTPFRQSYNLRMSVGSEKQNTYLSANYTNNKLQNIADDGYVFKAYMKSAFNVTKWLTVSAGIDLQYGQGNNTASYNTGFGNMEAYTPLLDNGQLGILHDTRIIDLADGKAYRRYTNTISTASGSVNPLMVEQLDAINASRNGTFDSYNVNVLDELGRGNMLSRSLSIRSYADADFKIYKGLGFKSSFSYETSKYNTEMLYDKDSYYMRFHRNRMIKNDATYTRMLLNDGMMTMNFTGSNNYVFRNQVYYNGTFAENHSINAVAGIELRENKQDLNPTITYLNYNPNTLTYQKNPDLYTLLTTGVSSYIYRNENQNLQGIYNTSDLLQILHRYVGFYANAGYTYKNLYNLSGSFRIDQADLFGTDPKYRYRPLWSLGASWNISNESFMEGIDWLSSLSLKGSYGITGNVDQNSTPYILARIESNSLYFQTPVTFTRLEDNNAPNPLLRWEKTTSYGGEVDFSLFNYLLNGKIEAYYKYSDDLLVMANTPSYATGYASGMANNGAMSNRGVEFTLSSPWFKKNDWLMTSTFIMSYNKNKVERIDYAPARASELVSLSYYLEGNPRYSLYAYRTHGLTSGGTDEQNGAPIIVRADGTELYTFNADGTLTLPSTAGSSALLPQDVVYMGSLEPTWIGSFTHAIEYKNWELSFMLTYSGGNVMRLPNANFATGGMQYSTLSADINSTWSPTNRAGTLPKSYPYYGKATDRNNASDLTSFWINSDANVVPADVIRLRNISLSYNLPQQYAKKVGMQHLKLIGQINNLWYWCAAGKGIDPDTQGMNGTSRTPGTPISYLLRLEIGF